MSEEFTSLPRRLLPRGAGCVVALLVWFFSVVAGMADPAGDLFLNAYLLREEGNKAEKSGDYKVAYDRYRAAARLYEQVAREFPDWKPAMVSYRRKGMSEQIAAVAEQAAKMELGRPATDTRPLPNPVAADGAALPTRGERPERGVEARPLAPAAGVTIRPPTAETAADDPLARKRIAELEQRQAGAQRVLEQLSRERDVLKTRLAEETNANLLAKYEAKKFREERDKLREQLGGLQEKGINASVADKARIAGLEKDLAAMEEKIGQSEVAAKAAKDAQLKGEAEARAKQVALQEATAAADAAKQQAQALEKELAGTREKLLGLEKVAEKQAVAEGVANEQARMAKRQAEDVASQLVEARKKITGLEEAIARQADAAGVKHGQDAALQNQLAEARGKIAGLESALQALRDSGANAVPIAATDVAAAADMAALRARVVALEKEKSGVAADMARAEARAAEAERKLAEARAERDTPKAQAELAAAVARLAEIEAQLAMVAREREAARADLMVVTTERDQLRAERDRLAAQLVKMENEPNLVQANDRLEKELTEARRQLVEMGNAREQDAARMKEVRQRLEQVEGELSVVRKENTAFREQMAQLEQRLTEARKSLEKEAAANQSELSEENRTLKSIVVRQLQQQAYRARARKLLLSELAKLEIDSKTMLSYIDQLEGKDSVPNPEEVARIDDNYIRALAGVELTGQFFTQDALPAPAAGTAPAPGGAANAPGTTVAAPPAPAAPAGAGSPPTVAAVQDRLPPGLAADPDERDAFHFQKTSLSGTAEKAFQRGDYARAEETYRLIVDADPADERMQCNLGVTLLKQAKFADASGRFQEALSLNEDNAFAHLMLGVCQWKTGKLDSAVDRFNRCLVIEPGNPQAWLYLGLIAMDRKKWQDAETAFKKSVEGKPGYAPAHYNLALVYTKPGFADPVEARRQYDESLRLGGAKDATLEGFLRIGSSRPPEMPSLPVPAASGAAGADPVIPPGVTEEELPEL